MTSWSNPPCPCGPSPRQSGPRTRRRPGGPPPAPSPSPACAPWTPPPSAPPRCVDGGRGGQSGGGFARTNPQILYKNILSDQRSLVRFNKWNVFFLRHTSFMALCWLMHLLTFPHLLFLHAWPAATWLVDRVTFINPELAAILGVSLCCSTAHAPPPTSSSCWNCVSSSSLRTDWLQPQRPGLSPRRVLTLAVGG